MEIFVQWIGDNVAIVVIGAIAVAGLIAAGVALLVVKLRARKKKKGPQE